ncbi:MAG TPA: hypothetical protein VHC22_20120 [Pirellulales bacterium]|nr:hypothetical protein [Pirellulales bacterium]
MKVEMVDAAGGSQPDRSPGDEPDARTRPPAADDRMRDPYVGGDPAAQRFSMWGLLGVVTGASLVLAVGTYFPKPIFAGAVGLATLITMVALSAMREPPAVFQLAWWTLLLIYLMAIGSAVLG